MSRRVIPCSFGAVGLLLVALALWLPIDFASRSQADPDTEPATSDMKLVASEAAFFVTFRPADFTGDELVKAVIQDIPKSLEDELHVSAYGIERLTVAVVRQGPVQIVRTKKPYDAEKLREAITESRHGGKFKDRLFKDGAPPKPEVNEKKAGGKKIYYVGDSHSWTRGFCPIDKNTFMVGSVAAIETLLTTKGKPSAEMTDALALASSHSLVLALDGKRLRTMMKQSREDGDRERMEWQKQRENRFKDKDAVKETVKDRFEESSRRDPKPARGEVFVSARVRSEAAAEEAKDDDLDLLFGSVGAGVFMLPYKPLLSAKFGLLTLDIKKTYKLTAKIDFADKGEMDDGETALKSILYVGRQLVVILPKHEHEFKGMKPLSVLAKKAFEEAKVERKDTTLSTTITLTPEAGLAAKVREGIAEERKNNEKRYDKGRPVFKDTAIKEKVRRDKD